MEAWFQPLQEIAGFSELSEKAGKEAGLYLLTGCLDSQKAHAAAGLSRKKAALLLVAENEQKAKELYTDMQLYDRDALYYPPKDLIFYQADLSGGELNRSRMQVIRALTEQKKVTVITSTGGCLDRLLPLRVFEKKKLAIRIGKELDLTKAAAHLAGMGYERTSQVETFGQFSVRGGILDVYDLTEELPWRIELWGDEVDSIRSFDPESQRSVENLKEVTIFPAAEEIGRDRDEEAFFQKLTDNLPDYFPKNSLIVLDEPNRIAANSEVLYKEFREFMLRRLEKQQALPAECERFLSPEQFLYMLDLHGCVGLSLLDNKYPGFEIREQYHVRVKTIGSYNNQFPLLLKDLRYWKSQGYRTILLSASRTRGVRLARELMDEEITAFFSEEEDRILQPGEILVTYGNARQGFEYQELKLVILAESDIFGAKERKRAKKKPVYSGERIRDFAKLSPGDYVVHESHGLGIYRGIEKVEVDKVLKDYIKIEYQKGSCLYIQATQLDSLQKYSSADGKQPHINRLGGQEWVRTKTRVRGAVANIAKDLVALYAARQQKEGFCYGPDTVWQQEFEEMFPYQETEDQLLAIEAVKKDMESTRIMDRLICGDVGFGKTEIAIRAAFKAVQENKQVVFLAPTTILAQQHYNNLVQRMKDFPVRVDLLCRFRTPAQQKKTLTDLKKGMVDIVVGTHRLLSKDVGYKDLGLLVIDEEQRFGVVHKEKIKHARQTVDVLSLTATPIPRTLHMSLIGIRDMSTLEEPPMNRVPIQTYVMEYDEEMVREAIARELARGGQVFYVYNRVKTISDMAGRIQTLVPEANVAIAHGQMSERELEQIMYRFVEGEIDVLVSTTIIETGMDISNVNTILIHDADNFGLSQLYQLRGRVGRVNRTAYAFLLYRRDKVLREIAEKRLHTIRAYTELGSGTRIAMRDLELRGAGNLLGSEQHGHMEAVGYDLYCKMLSEAVREAKGIRRQEEFETTIDLLLDAFLPPGYIASESQKLEIYKRIAGIGNHTEYEEMQDELLDRFGDLPRSVENLLKVAELKAMAHEAYITEIKQLGEEIRISLYPLSPLDVTGIPDLLTRFGRKLKFKVDQPPYFLFYPFLNKQQQEPLLEQLAEFVSCLRELVPAAEEKDC